MISQLCGGWELGMHADPCQDNLLTSADRRQDNRDLVPLPQRLALGIE